MCAWRHNESHFQVVFIALVSDLNFIYNMYVNIGKESIKSSIISHLLCKSVLLLLQPQRWEPT